MHTRSTLVYLRLCAGVLLAVLALGCKDGTAPEATVESVTITGAPTSPVMAGSTVQLVAAALSQAGASIPGAKIAWNSRDTLIAKVSTSGLVTALGVGPVAITAASNNKEATVTLDVRAGGPVGSPGGVVSAPGGRATLTVPAGSLQQETTLMLRPAQAAPSHTRMAAGTAWEVGPETVSFWKGATLAVRYEGDKVPAGISPTSLQLYFLQNGAWVLVRGSTVDPATGMVQGRIGWAGTYAAIATPTDRVTLTGTVAGAALYVGQTGTLGATLQDVIGDTLRGRPVAWSSSDPSKVAVDSTGKVTAVGPGTAAISASNEGKSGTTTITVFARPVASWGQTADWTTFQGNARHTGEIDATVDPAAFEHLWTKTLAGVPLNPVTTGDGKVFVTTNPYIPGTDERLLVVDGRTGNEVWSRGFGAIHSVHPPAYGGGRVYLTTGGHGDSFLWAFDAGSGTMQFRSPYGNQWSRWFAPVVLNSTVYMAGGSYGGMYAFNAQSGERLWFSETPQYDEWVPAVANGRAYTFIGEYSGNTRLSVVDAATGTELHNIPDPGFSGTHWQMNVTPVLGSSNNLLATLAGRLVSFDLAGRRIGWSRDAKYTGVPAVRDGVIYVATNGQIEARRESDGALVWMWIPPEGRAQGTMVVTRNILFVGTAANTYAVDIAGQRHSWSYPVSGALAVSKEGVLYIAQSTGKLTAIDLR